MEGVTQSREFILHDFTHNHEGCNYDFQNFFKNLVYLTEGWTWWFVKFLPFQFL